MERNHVGAAHPGPKHGQGELPNSWCSALGLDLVPQFSWRRGLQRPHTERVPALFSLLSWIQENPRPPLPSPGCNPALGNVHQDKKVSLDFFGASLWFFFFPNKTQNWDALGSNWAGTHIQTGFFLEKLQSDG